MVAGRETTLPREWSRPMDGSSHTRRDGARRAWSSRERGHFSRCARSLFDGRRPCRQAADSKPVREGPDCRIAGMAEACRSRRAAQTSQSHHRPHTCRNTRAWRGAQRSGAIRTSALPRSCGRGPSTPGLMSKSKISVGRYNVAQAFGMSTTPEMCPCTGAVPRIA